MCMHLMGPACAIFACVLLCVLQVGQEISHDELHEYKDHYACLAQVGTL
jgi:hypothetical protein